MIMMLTQFFGGLIAYGQAIFFLKDHKLWRLLMWPAALGLVVYGVLLTLAVVYAPDLGRLIWTFMIPQTEFWGAQALEVSLRVISVVLVLLLFLFSFRLIMVNLMAPLLIFLAEQVYTVLLGKEKLPPFRWKTFLVTAAEGVYEALRLLGLQLLLVLGFLLLALFIPLLAPIVPLAILLLESFFVGLAMVDLSSGVMGYRLLAMRQFRKKYYAFALGIGIGFSLLLFVPLLGALFAPSLAAVAATLGIARIESQRNRAN